MTKCIPDEYPCPLKGSFLFFFLDKKEPKNQGCGKIAKNGFVRLNPPNSPAFGRLKQRRLFNGSLHHFLSALFPRPVLLRSIWTLNFN